MHSRPRSRRPSHTTVVAYLALFAALSGTAYAALGRNSVGTRQLKRAAVHNSDIAANAVTGSKVAPGAIGDSDVAPGVLGGQHIADGSLTGAEVADASLTGADLAPDSLTGASIQEFTLGAVPVSNSVNGVGMSSFSAALPQSSSAVPIFQEGALQVQFDCTATEVRLLFQMTSAPSGEFARLLKLEQGDADVAGIFVSTSQQAVQNTQSIDAFITHYRAGGVITRVDLQAVRFTNGIGTDDCFVGGFVRRSPV